MSENRYCIDYARLGTAGCKKCKTKIAKGTLRIAKVVSNPFSEDAGDMKQWFHVNCIFEMLKRARATTKKIEEPDDLEGWDTVKKEDQKLVLQCIKDFGSKTPTKTTKAAAAGKQQDVTPKKGAVKNKEDVTPKKGDSTLKDDGKLMADKGNSSSDLKNVVDSTDEKRADNSFREFRKLCASIADENGYLAKTNIVAKFIADGSSGDGFQGNLYLWIKLLLPGIVKRIYNIQSKQLVKLFSNIFGTYLEEMIEDLEDGDAAETIKTFYEKSTLCPPIKKSTLTLQEIDAYLEDLSNVTKEDDQMRILTKITKRCTSNDLKMVVRLIKHDLRINSGAKHILDAVHPDAYRAFQTSRNLKDVIEMVQAKSNGGGSLKIKASLMTPVLPMLAEACKSVEYAMNKCPKGMFAEIKYDGERVQVHKQGSNFSYFSRSLKPVLPHKVQHFKDYIPTAFPNANDLILDSEVLLIDTITGIPLPFGTLGKHKKTAFKDANVCLFVFDCIYYNGESLMDKPLNKRKEMLQKVMQEIPNHIMFSEMKVITKADQLNDMITKILRRGLEGLVLKDYQGIYEPGRRHWLKVKKDYLHEGALADTADLVVLGAFYGTGNKGGMMSTFLMGCFDPLRKKWCTVTKVHGGHDDATLKRLQKELKMEKISKDADKVPKWLDVHKNMVPDFVCENPEDSQVWEITGAEFSKTEIHTADGISIRFPRVTKIRKDKDWKTATNLDELRVLFKVSRDPSNLPDLGSSTSSKKSDDNGDHYGSETDVDEEMLSDTEVALKKPKTPVKRGKRSSGDDSDGSPVKKVARQTKLPFTRSPKKEAEKSKPVCKYGASCYLTKKAHREEFEHPPKSTIAKHPTKNPLPDVFTDVIIYLSKDEDDFDDLCRYIIAYDGELVNELNAVNATHVVTSDMIKLKRIEKKLSVKAEIVSIDWLQDCIKSKQLKPTGPYLHSRK
uniref:DNA ligase n=1 Tax=Strigamia maritima TaxID=126957 RepID=T1IZP4_STRMM